MLSFPLDITHGLKSFPLEYTQDRTTLGVHAIIVHGQHRLSDDVGYGMSSYPLDNTHGQMMSFIACHHSYLTTHKVGRHGLWNAIIALVLHI